MGLGFLDQLTGLGLLETITGLKLLAVGTGLELLPKVPGLKLFSSEFEIVLVLVVDTCTGLLTSASLAGFVLLQILRLSTQENSEVTLSPLSICWISEY